MSISSGTSSALWDLMFTKAASKHFKYADHWTSHCCHILFGHCMKNNVKSRFELGILVFKTNAITIDLQYLYKSKDGSLNSWWEVSNFAL